MPYARASSPRWSVNSWTAGPSRPMPRLAYSITSRAGTTPTVVSSIGYYAPIAFERRYTSSILTAGDLDDSTTLVDTMKPLFAAEIYKCFLGASNNSFLETKNATQYPAYSNLDFVVELLTSLHSPNYAYRLEYCLSDRLLACADRIVRSEGGEITSYDGDRIMAVFIGDAKESVAARTALKINFAVQEIISPAIRNQYPNTHYSLKHVVGIDTSNLFIARTGIRGADDLVWVGRAANCAAKLSAQRGPATQITTEVYEMLSDNSKIG